MVFARAPLAGRVKTRIAQRIGDAAAANLHRRLVRAAVAAASAARCGPVELHVTRRHAFFRTLGVPVRLQRGADLGERMYRALARHRRAIVIGADAPALMPADIARAARWLHGGADIVLAPADDGGYVLIGARRLTPAVFAAVDDSDLARQTRPAAESDSRPLDHTERRTVGRPIDRAGLGSAGRCGAVYGDACRI